MIFWIFLSKFESLLVLAVCCGGRCSSRECSQQWWIVHLLSVSAATIRDRAECYYKDNYKWNIMAMECSNNKESWMTILHPPWHIQDTMMPTYPIKHHEIEKNDELWPRANEMALLLLSDQLNIKTQQQNSFTHRILTFHHNPLHIRRALTQNKAHWAKQWSRL